MTIRHTKQAMRLTVAVLAWQDTDPQVAMWGYELAARSHVRTGTLYPLLDRFVKEGWLVEIPDEQADSRGGHRPPRRCYRVSAQGLAEMRELLAPAVQLTSASVVTPAQIAARIAASSAPAAVPCRDMSVTQDVKR